MGGTYPAAEAFGAITGKNLNKLIRGLLKLHSTYKINNIIRLPFKGLWDNILFDTSRLAAEDIIYFIFYEDFKLAYSRDYIEHIRCKYKHCKIIYVFQNPLKWSHIRTAQKVEALKDCYDLRITMNKSDAEKWDLLFCDYWPCLLPDKAFEAEKASDVFFCGAAKDRLHKILSVYERLTDAGLKCDFWITGVPEREQKYSPSIHYTEKATYHWLSYDEILQRDMNTKCVLEILPFGQNYSSLRVCEALWYHKKLLTTNINAPQEWFYHPEIVQVFTEAQDIDTSFITQPLSSEYEQRIFSNMKIGDFGIFADWLIKNAG